MPLWFWRRTCSFRSTEANKLLENTNDDNVDSFPVWKIKGLLQVKVSRESQRLTFHSKTYILSPAPYCCPINWGGHILCVCVCASSPILQSNFQNILISFFFECFAPLKPMPSPILHRGVALTFSHQERC